MANQSFCALITLRALPLACNYSRGLSIAACIYKDRQLLSIAHLVLSVEILELLAPAVAETCKQVANQGAS